MSQGSILGGALSLLGVLTVLTLLLPPAPPIPVIGDGAFSLELLDVLGTLMDCVVLAEIKTN